MQQQQSGLGEFIEEGEFESYDSFFERLVSEGYYVRFNSSVAGTSGILHPVDILCESRSTGEMIVGYKLFSDSFAKGPLANDEYSDEQNEIYRIIALTAIGYDAKCKMCIVIRHPLHASAKALALRNEVMIIQDF